MRSPASPLRVAFFVTAHGFGHAARSLAVAGELARRRPVEAHVFTGVPAWFFEGSPTPIHHHALDVDVGLVQRTALDVDRAATVERLERCEPLRPEALDAMARRLRELEVELVVADIAPAGIAAAAKASIPSAVVENFTWDWIYRELGWDEAAVAEAAARMERLYAGAHLRIQTRPGCAPGAADLEVGAIARPLRRGRQETRRTLGLGESEPVALLSMGGVPWRYTGLQEAAGAGLRLVVIGEVDGDLPPGAVRVPHRSGLHHPDLVAAADVIVGKLGYSTLAEAWQAGCGLAWMDRPDFPEYRVLAEHVRRCLPEARISRRDFESGAWVSRAAAVGGRQGGVIDFDDGLAPTVDALESLP